MLSLKKPLGFTEGLVKVACCVHSGGRMLLLLDPETGEWMLPMGIIRERATQGAMAKILHEILGWNMGWSQLKFVDRVFYAPTFGTHCECWLYFLDLRDKLEVRSELDHLWISPTAADRSLIIRYPTPGYLALELMKMGEKLVRRLTKARAKAKARVLANRP